MAKFDPTYASQLLDIALADLESAKVLAAAWQRGRVENIFFLVQQSVEKSLKAYLCHKHGDFPMVHDLGILLGKMDQLPPQGYSLVLAIRWHSALRDWKYSFGQIRHRRCHYKRRTGPSLGVIPFKDRVK